MGLLGSSFGRRKVALPSAECKVNKKNVELFLGRVILISLGPFCDILEKKTTFLADLVEKDKRNFFKMVKMSNFAVVKKIWRQRHRNLFTSPIHPVERALLSGVLGVCCCNCVYINKFNGCFSDFG